MQHHKTGFACQLLSIVTCFVSLPRPQVTNDILLHMTFWFLTTIYFAVSVDVYCDSLVLGLSQYTVNVFKTLDDYGTYDNTQIPKYTFKIIRKSKYLALNKLNQIKRNRTVWNGKKLYFNMQMQLYLWRYNMCFLILDTLYLGFIMTASLIYHFESGFVGVQASSW